MLKRCISRLALLRSLASVAKDQYKNEYNDEHSSNDANYNSNCAALCAKGDEAKVGRLSLENEVP